MGVVCGYGLYKTGQGIREQKYVKLFIDREEDCMTATTMAQNDMGGLRVATYSIEMMRVADSTFVITVSSQGKRCGHVYI